MKNVSHSVEKFYALSQTRCKMFKNKCSTKKSEIITPEACFVKSKQFWINKVYSLLQSIAATYC